MPSKLNSHLLDSALKILVILTPTLVSLLLVYGFTQRKFDVYTPMLQDEVEYWREAETFKSVGFNGGYYTYNEVAAKDSSIHFSAWGPAYPALAGTIGRVLGWSFVSGPLFNAGLISLALAIFVFTIRPDRRMLLALLLVMATFWPVIAYLPITMQESLNQAIGIILATLFYKLIRARGQVSTPVLLGGIALVFLAALVRPTWAVLFFPLFALAQLPVGRWLRLFAAFVLNVLCFGLFVYWTAPADDPKNLLKLSALPLNAVLAAFRQNISHNIETFKDDQIIMALQHLQIAMILLLCAIVGILLQRRQNKHLSSEKLEVPFHLFNIGIPFALNFAFYLIGNDFRILAGHVLLSILLLVAFQHYRSAVAFALSNFVAIIAILTFYITYVTPHFWIDPDQLAIFHRNTTPLFKYQPSDNAWCNTLLTPLAFAPEILMLPPQMGEAFLVLKDSKIPVDLTYPVKSRYLLLDDLSYQQMKDNLHVEKLAEIPLGTLYLNKDAACPSN